MKKIPLRKCLATGEICPKNELLRIVKSPEGKVFLDHSLKANGRGAYIKASDEALAIAKKKNVLAKALEVAIPDSVYQEIEKEINARKNNHNA